MDVEPIPFPWEQHDGEEDRAFAAFQHYRDTPAMERSIRRTAKALGYEDHSWLGRVSSRFSWVERSSAWDQELDRRKREEMVSETVEMGKRQATQAAAFARVLVLPVQTFMERLQEHPEQISDFKNASIEKHFEWVLRAARVWPNIVQMERAARGIRELPDYTRTAEPGVVVTDDERTAAVIQVLQEVGLPSARRM